MTYNTSSNKVFVATINTKDAYNKVITIGDKFIATNRMEFHIHLSKLDNQENYYVDLEEFAKFKFVERIKSTSSVIHNI